VIFAPFEGFGTATSHFADEREQYFSNQLRYELIGDRLSSEIMAIGMAYRLKPWLSMGLGMLILPGARTTAPVYVRNAADLSQVDINVAINQEARRAITAGVLVRPIEQLRVGVVFQDEIWFAVGGSALVQLRGEEAQGPVTQPLNLVTAYSPTRVSGSVAWVSEDLTASIEGTYRVWSRYLDNHAAQPGFDDTVDVKVGVEWPVSEETYARAGLGYAPSPVPAQTGRTNYVDNDRIGFGFGAGRVFEVWGQELTIDAGFQVQALITERVRKRQGAHPDCADGVTALCDEIPDLDADTPLTRAVDTIGLQTGNPGFPGYTHGGYVVAASLDVKWRF
jgi:long-subunit fatty acid transport protein